MRVLFRADASPLIGTGHVLRCLALAEAVHDVDGKALLASASELGRAQDRLEREAIAIHRIGADPGSLEDARRTASVARHESVDWLVIDGYHFEPHYLSELTDAPWRLAVIDDFAQAVPPADLVVNGNLFAEHSMYSAWPPKVDLLIGPRFALLRREFRRARRPRVLGPQARRRVLIALGGSDPSNLTASVIGAVARLPNVEARVLVGMHHPDPDGVAQQAEAARFESFRDVRTVVPHLSWASIAVGAAGTSALEYAWSGRPVVALAVADNQRPVAAAIEALGIGMDGTTALHGRGDSLSEAIERLLADQQGLRSMSRRAWAMVDGQGAARTASTLGQPALSLRAARWEDSDVLLAWATDPQTRTSSFRSHQIHPDEHEAWLRRQLGDPNTLMLMAEQSGKPAGVVRFAVTGDAAIISVTVSPALRLRGLAPRLIDRGCRILFEAKPDVRDVRAYMKPSNAASLAAFAAAGFEKAPRREDDDMPHDAICAVRRSPDIESLPWI